MNPDEAIGRAMRGSIWLSKSDTPLYELPDFSEAEAERRSRVGEKIVSQIDALDVAALPRELATTVRIARHRSALWSREADWWWLVCDPLRVGFFSLFAPTAYSGAHLLVTIHKVLGEHRFRSAGDVHRYLSLVADYGRPIDQFAERTRGQAERGIRMPRAQFDRAVALFASLRAGAPQALAVADARVASIGANDAPLLVAASVRALVLPAFDRLLAGLDAPYRTVPRRPKRSACRSIHVEQKSTPNSSISTRLCRSRRAKFIRAVSAACGRLPRASSSWRAKPASTICRLTRVHSTVTNGGVPKPTSRCARKCARASPTVSTLGIFMRRFWKPEAVRTAWSRKTCAPCNRGLRCDAVSSEPTTPRSVEAVPNAATAIVAA